LAKIRIFSQNLRIRKCENERNEGNECNEFGLKSHKVESL